MSNASKDSPHLMNDIAAQLEFSKGTCKEIRGMASSYHSHQKNKQQLHTNKKK